MIFEYIAKDNTKHKGLVQMSGLLVKCIGKSTVCRFKEENCSKLTKRTGKLTIVTIIFLNYILIFYFGNRKRIEMYCCRHS